ncbi:Phenolphthiocerol/phthiocerol polyketide synthase subunit C ((Phenol)carboxyphthiodiolenone synthase subunit C) (Beta-ketoacyl-acyl-carrier-protein synthase I) (Phthiocerol synthesis polyketide synthase type I PpsC), partial [Durusdinium trenchii]
YREPTIPLISNVTGRQLAEGEVPDANYWRTHARNPVLFESGMKELANHRVDVYLEVGPTPNLVSMGRTCISSGKSRWLPSLRPGQSDWQVIGKSLQTMYETGFDVDWHEFDRPYRPHRVELPEYPFERDHYWIDQVSDWYRGEQTAATHPLLGNAVSTDGALTSFESTVQAQSHGWLDEHSLFGTTAFPAAAYLEMAWAAARELSRTSVVRVEEISLRQMLTLSGAQPTRVRVQTQSRESLRPKFQVYSQQGTEADAPWTLHATGTLASHGWMSASRRMATADVNEIRDLCSDAVSVEAFYEALAQRGLTYSGDFRSLRELYIGSANALGLANASDQFADDVRFCISPALLDAGLQVLGAAAISQIDGGSVMYCPTHFGAATLYCRPTGKVWLHATIEPRTTETASGSLRGAVALIDEEGRVCARLENIRMVPVGLTAGGNDASEPTTEGVTALSTRWQMIDPIPAVAGSQILDAMDPETWIILADRTGLGSAMASRLRRSGQRCLVIYAGSTSLKIDEETFECRWQDRDELRRLISLGLEGAAEAPARLVHLWSLDLDSTVDESLPAEFDWLTNTSVVDSVLTCVEGGEQPLPLLAATRRGHIVNRAPEDGTPFQTLTWGVIRNLGQQVRQLAPTLVDLDETGSPADDVDALLNEFLARSGHEVALRGMEAWTPILQVDDCDEQASRPLISSDVLSDPTAAFRLEIGASQSIEGVEATTVERTPVPAGHVEIEVAAAGVNFSDVLKTLGLYPRQDDAVVAIGLECVGTISAVGDDVDEFSVGDRVLALTQNAFGRWVHAPQHAIVRCPQEIDDLTAAGASVAYTTAIYSLLHLARLRSGDRVLIHSASGGLGHAAIQVAQQVGADIFVTAGSEQKRAHLRSLGVEHVFDSRTTDFADAILDCTNGEGVDVVLNSLGGEFVPRSLALLRPCGRFIDLAKTDAYQNPGLDRSRFNNNLAYFAVDMDQLYRTSPRVTGELMHEMLEYLPESKCPVASFSVADARSAFRLMGQRRHLGKLVLTAPKQTESAPSDDLFHAGTDYIIAGATGPFAHSWIDWMTTQGARQFTFASIANAAEFGEDRPACLDEEGCSVRFRDDLGSPEGSSLAEVVTTAINASAGVKALVFLSPALNSDSSLTSLPEHVAELWTLHQATLNGEISRFITLHPFIGSDGNSTLGPTLAAFADAVAADRWQLGLHSQSIALDLAEFDGELDGSDAEVETCSAETASRAAAAWNQVRERLETDDPAVTIANLAGERIQERFPHRLPAILSGLIQGPQGGQPTTEGVVGEVSLAANLRQNPPGDRKVVLLDHFVQMLARVTSQEASRIKPQASIRRLGLDSLMTMELKNSIEADLSISMNLSVLFQDPSIEQLVDYALDLWQTSGNSTERQEALTGSSPSESGTELPIG